MVNEGDRLDDSTTSYGLQPPRQPGPSGPSGTPGARPSSSPSHGPSHEPAYEPSYEPTEIAPSPSGAPGGDPGTGRVIGGRYRLMARLGHGGMGTVWRAHDEVVDRDVAVKEPRLPGHLSARERETMYTRMRREARTAARIDHPSVVTIHDVVVEDEQPWIVMELVQGRSLADVLGEGTIDVREAARIGLAVAGALDAAHEKGVLHRDVKPDNVLLGRYDRVVLTDFGIAKVQGEQGLTETGAFVGSPEFVAPERVLGQRPGPESDLWSLGVVLYAAVEGVSPFRRSNSPATLQAVLSAEPQRPARALSGSGAFGMLLTRLLSKEPALRPDAAEVRQTLADVARPPQQSPRPVPGPGGGSALVRLLRGFGGKLRTSRGWQFGTGGAVVAIGAALALFFVHTADQAPEGYATKNEDKRVRASLVVPQDYERSVDNDEVTYTDPGDVISLKLVRNKDAKENALAEANAKKEFYEGGARDDSYNYHMKDVKARVAEAEQQGKEAAEISTTYLPYDAEDGDPKKFRHELVYVNENGVGWDLSVDMPAKGGSRKDGEAVFREAKQSLKINDL
ncbi:serine/threonine protein kinase [Streptomyces oryzae]|uniref:non-specific serine/threonine protein kinase n=1 Tax=Streptomyces oryzae TaxID=1434886 RepID=A0ABS3XL08_9ACTN|nr:serine/threonine-protein kinase [Streptomyces oryzae]MBO8196054.1 serine/threonine protein kinase [Streptomyces oryzae]